MKYILIAIILVAISCSTKAQQTDTIKESKADTAIVDSPSTPPEFPGGLPKLYRYLSRIARYPAKAKEYNIQGKVILMFVIKKDGSISDITVKKSVSPELDNETIRVIKLVPKFIPGKNKNGDPVRCYYEFPFTWSLQQVN